MSRGPGRWQRAILDAVEQAIDPETGFTQWVSVDEVYNFSQGQPLTVSLDAGYTRRLSVGSDDHGYQHQHLTDAEREGIRRAMRTLTKTGKVELGKVRQYQPTQQAWEDSPYYSKIVERMVLAVRALPDLTQQVAEAESRAEQAKRLRGLLSDEAIEKAVEHAAELRSRLDGCPTEMVAKWLQSGSGS